MNSRLKKLLAKLRKEHLNGLIVSSASNISYLSQYRSRDSYLLVSEKACIYFTDSRYMEEAELGIRGSDMAIEEIKDSFYKSVSLSCKHLGLKRMAFEEENLTLAQYSRLRAALPEKIKLAPASGLVEDLRQTKSREELENIREATRITIKAFRFVRDMLTPGKKEIEIAAELERVIRKYGASSSAFDIIVASGPNSSQPHHVTSERRIKNNEPVLIDMGVDYHGYKSDLTRVFFLGKISPLARRVYDIISEARDKAIALIKTGVPAYKIDAAARAYIAKKGFGPFFGHNLGHGVGLEVHEAPRISGKEKKPLKEGMVFTVEPGIYLPGEFGIRLEDMVAVTGKGCEIISGAINK